MRSLFFFFFNDTATTEIYTLSLHDALPILVGRRDSGAQDGVIGGAFTFLAQARTGQPNERDRKSTRLNSSHSQISYAVFCLKKKTRLRRAGGLRKRQEELLAIDAQAEAVPI